MSKILMAGLAVAVLVLILTVLQSRDNTTVSPPAPIAPVPAERKELPRVPSGTDWSAFSEDDLEQFLAQLDEARPDRSGTTKRNEFSVIVEDGETIITDGYEIGDGRFAFTYFTPTIVEGETGQMIQVFTQRMELSLNGEKNELAIPAMTFRPGQRGGITSSFKSESGEETEGWSIDLETDIVPGGIFVQGSTGY